MSSDELAGNAPILPLSLVVGTVLLAAACSRVGGDAAAETAQQPSPPQEGVRVINVEAVPVERGSFTGFIEITGQVEALQDVTMSAEETGRIVRFYAVKGQHVRRGQRIAKIDDGFIAAQVNEARAAAKLAREEWKRQRQLWEEDSMGTEMAYVQRKYQADIADSKLRQLETRWGKTVVRAPISGVFDEKYIESGEMVVPGGRIARIVAADRVKISAGVPERFARSVSTGDRAEVSFDIFPDRMFQGHISFVGSSVNENNRTFPIEILLDNPEGIMKPAMVANVKVQREHLDDVIIVPQQVVLRSATGYKVFVVAEREGYQVARAKEVKLGPSSGNNVVISDGLDVGDLLITLGQQLVDDNSRIRLVNQAAAVSSRGVN
ncbi:MAG: efflux RND transporter periplasmic adaptor subunit [Gemmatimonadales bacterium]